MVRTESPVLCGEARVAEAFGRRALCGAGSAVIALHVHIILVV